VATVGEQRDMLSIKIASYREEFGRSAFFNNHRVHRLFRALLSIAGNLYHPATMASEWVFLRQLCVQP